MGRGGRAAYGPGGSRVAFARDVLEDSPLADRPIAELKKHAEQRGLKNDGTRDDLLLALRPYSKVRAVGIVRSLRERYQSCRVPACATRAQRHAMFQNQRRTVLLKRSNAVAAFVRWVVQPKRVAS